MGNASNKINAANLLAVLLVPHASPFHLPSPSLSYRNVQPITSYRSTRNYLRNGHENEGGTTTSMAAPSHGRINGTETELLSSYETVYDAETSRIPSFLDFNPDPVKIKRGLFAGFVPRGTRFSDTLQDGMTQFSSTDETETLDNSADENTTASLDSSNDTKNSRDVWKARLLLILSAALYGTNFTMVKSLDESLSVGLCSTLRFGFAALSMLPWLFAPIHEDLKTKAKSNVNNLEGMSEGSNVFLRFGEEPTRLSAGLAGMEIGIWNSIGYIAQAVGLRTTTASKSAFICSMAVVTVPILDYIVGKQLMQRQIIGAFLAAIGVWSLEMGGQQDFSTLTTDDIASLIQPIMFGLGFWRMEAAMEKYPTEAGRLAAAQLLMVFLVSLSYLISWAPIEDGSLLSSAYTTFPNFSEVMVWLKDPNILGMLVYTGVITTAFTIWMETMALKTLSAAETTLIFSTEPLFGAAFAAVVANECLGPEAAIGALFIIGGCLVSGIDISKHFKGNSLLHTNEE